MTWNRVEERYRSWLFGDQSLHRTILGPDQFYFDREIISPALIKKNRKEKKRKKSRKLSTMIRKYNRSKRMRIFPDKFRGIIHPSRRLMTQFALDRAPPPSTWWSEIISTLYYTLGRGGEILGLYIPANLPK